LIRVGGGSARGRLLKAPRRERTTLGRVKQALFDMLAWRLAGTRFLDVFAGSGAVGIEALSRGAQWACFIEARERHGALIRENLARCGLSEKAEVICAEAGRGLAWLTERGKEFDIVFLDPPYGSAAPLRRALQRLAESPVLLAPGGIVIVERARQRPLEEMPEALERVDSRTFGDSVLELLRRKQE